MALDVCPTTQYAAGSITSLTINPTSGPQGTTFNVLMNYRITNTTGAGQVLIQVNPPASSSNSQPFGSAATILAETPGAYSISLSFQASPTQDISFDPGLYGVVGAVCESTCGAVNKYAYTIAEKFSRFSITKS